MAEEKRFCENCGTEISQTTNFCPNCGAAQRPDPDVPTGPPPPTPEPGQISTPSADVPPPPPERGSTRNRALLFGGIGCVVLLLVLLGACAVIIGAARNNSSTSGSVAEGTTQAQDSGKKHGGGAQDSSSKESTVGIGQTATVADASWVVTSARPETQLRSQFGTQSKQGNFVVVDFNFTNNGTEAKTLTTTIINLYDSQNRKSSPDTDTFSYIPNDKNIFITQVNPGVTKDGEVIFSVAPGASGFKLELSNTNFLKNDKTYVDLGF